MSSDTYHRRRFYIKPILHPERVERRLKSCRKVNGLQATSPGRETTTSPKTASDSVTWAPVLVALGLALSRILGLVRDALTARYFSPDVRDAFVIAFRLPNVFRRVLGEGAFASGFVPLIASARASGGSAEAARAASGVFAGFMGIMATATALGVVLMEPALRALLVGTSFRADPEKLALTIRLAQIMFGFLGLASLFAYLAAALQALGRFALAAFAPVLFNGSMIVAALMEGATGSEPNARAETLAWSVVIGGALQVAVLVPAVARTDLWPRRSLLSHGTAVVPALKAVFASAFGSAFLPLAALANLGFATWLAPGAHSHLYLADRVLELPLSLISVSVGSALLPSLADLWARTHRDEFVARFRLSFTQAFAFAALCGSGLAALSEPIARVLFMGGDFSVVEAVATAAILRVHGVLLLIAVASRLLAQAFYSARRPGVPVRATLLAFSVHAVLALPLVYALGTPGLAVSMAGAELAQGLYLAHRFSRDLSPLSIRGCARSALWVAAASVSCAAVALLTERGLSSAPWPEWLRLGLAMSAAAVAFGVCALVSGARVVR